MLWIAALAATLFAVPTGAPATAPPVAHPPTAQPPAAQPPAAQPPDRLTGELPTGEQILSLARTHRDAIAGASRVEKELDDLQVLIVAFPDALEWVLLRELIAGLEKKETTEAVEKRLAKVRKELAKAAGRPGLSVELRHRVVPEDSDRKLPRTVHIFPGDPKKLLRTTYDEKLAEWEPLEPPEGLVLGRVRVAKYHTTSGRHLVPLIQELKPKGERWIFEGESATFLCALPSPLADMRGEILRIEFPNFDRFRGPSPEPNLIDLNATASTLDRELKLTMNRSWLPPWPPLPAELEKLLGEGESG